MSAKASDGEYSLKLTGGGGISIDKIVSEALALQILKLVMGDIVPGAAGGAGIGTPASGAGAAAKLTETSTPKAFMAGKRPKTDMERVTCLAYYLTHHRATPAFKTKALSDLNVDAAGDKFSNISATARNAAASANGLLSSAGGGNKQITSRGEALVEALPDREKVAAALAEHPARKARKKRVRKKTK
jgi:hypothetical protein